MSIFLHNKAMNDTHTLKTKFEQGGIVPSARPVYQDHVFDLVATQSPFIRDKQFTRVSTRDLEFLFRAVDYWAFQGAIGEHCHRHGLPLTFRLGKRMTKTGGTTTRRVFPQRPSRPEFEIAISPNLLFNTFQTEAQATVAGVLCSTTFDAMRLIMEHEILHLAEMLIWQGSSCAAQRFRLASWRFFGHQSSKHELLTPSTVAKTHFNIAIGDRVRFQIDGRAIEGTVNRVTQRATVLVPDSKGMPYNDGHRYAKYYVPLRMLARCS